MSFVQVKTFQYQGLEKKEILVQGVKTRGLAQLSLTGNISNTLRDSRDKIKAVVAQACSWGPVDKILIHLLPIEIPKYCPKLELPVALAIRALLSAEELGFESLKRLAECSYRGSLTLSGELQEVEVIENDGRRLGAFKNLEEVWSFVLGHKEAEPPSDAEHSEAFFEVTTAPEARGRDYEKFWLRVAATARVPVLLMGAPGIGKTHLAKWAQCLVGDSGPQLRADVLRIWTLAGKMKVPWPPVQNPHARSHLAEFVGVSQKEMPRPGIFSLAHGGLLVLDEFPELARDCREILRNIIDEKEVRRNTKSGLISWPADFWLILTANPCLCGLARGDDLSQCRCAEGARLKYISRFSGPLLDRIGLKLFLTPEQRPLSPCLRELSVESLEERSLPLPSLRLNARQMEIYARLWRAFLRIAGYSPEKEAIFREFLCEQASFQERWMCHVYH